MKKIILTFAMIFLLVPLFTILASEDEIKISFGEIQKQENKIVNEDIGYNNITLNTNNKLTQEIFTAKIPFNSKNTDIVVHDKNLKYATVTDIAKDYESKTGRKVYAAINADFFWAELPIDHYVKNGEVIHKGLGNEFSVNFGFNNKGEINIGKVPTLTSKSVRITHENGSTSIYKIDGIGGIPFNENLYVYPAGSRIVAKNSGKYLIKIDDGFASEHVESYTSGVIERGLDQELSSDEVLIVPEGYYGLIYRSDDSSNELLNYLFQELNNNTKVEIIESPTGDFEQLNWGVGAKNVLVKDNVVMPEPFKPGSSGESNQPRTTFGVTNNNEFFIQVIDGRQPGYSSGLTTTLQAQLAFDMGAKSAVELDGGGSSAFLLRVNDELKVMNKPSDGQERKVINAILFTEKVNTPDLIKEEESETDETENSDSKKVLWIALGVIGIISLISVVVFVVIKFKK